MPITDTGVHKNKNDTVALIAIKYFFLLVFGAFCLASYSPVINIIALGGITLVFLHSLDKEDYFSFLIILFFSNQFIFGNDKGGLFNLAALLALLLYNLFWKNTFFNNKSSFGKTTTFLISILVYCQILSLVANDKAVIGSKISSLFIFIGLIILLFQMSKVKITESDFIRFITVLCMFTFYSLVVSLNQKYNFIPFDLVLFPVWKSSAEFELDILRCTGTLQNFEAYAEYSLSIIIFLLPGILSGSFKKISSKLYIMGIAIILMSIMGIVLSATRSSFFLMPIAIVFIVANQFSRIKISSLMPFVIIIAAGFIINSFYTIIDFSAFIERSKDMQVKKVSDITSGSEINRGDIFDFAFKKIARSNGMLGEGYFTTVADYNTVHFDVPNPKVGDYHNLYLGIAVFWGYFGAASFLLLFFTIIFKGFSTYKKYKHKISGFQLDLLLGFNTLFIFFFINQYKIIFLRECNYAIVIFLLLIMYNSLINTIKKTS